MIKHVKWMLAAVVVGLLVVTAPGAGPTAGHDLLGVTWERGPLGGPAITLIADGPVELESFVLEAPDRLVVDLPGVTSRLDRQRFDVATGGVLRVRASQHRTEPEPITRIVIDLEHPLSFSIGREGARTTVEFGAALALWPAEAPREPGSRYLTTGTAAAVAAPAPMETAELPPTAAEAAPSRAVEPEVVQRLLTAPAFAAPQPQADTAAAPPPSYETKRINFDKVNYTGKRISLNLVDADIKQVFRLFHEISGLNFVLDPSVSGRLTIVLDNVPWDQALDIILKNNGMDKVLENNVVRIATTQKLAQEAAARKQLMEAKELEVEPVTLTRTLSYAKAVEVRDVLMGRGRSGGGGGGGSGRGLLSERGSVIADERTNTLIVTDIPKKITAIDELLEALDHETPQVMIEARIVETSRTFSQDLGVIWGFSAAADEAHGTATGLAFPHNASVKYGLNLPGEGGASNLAFKFSNVIDSFTLDVALNTLETEGQGRILSSPKIATQNNEKAEIEQGVRIPITNTTATEIQVEFVSASLLLQVTPQITAEGTVILDVTVENNSPDFVNRAGGIPSIRTQRAQTKLLVNDGGTTVIGGIFVVNEGQSEIGVPWFRKIPVFGWLFKNRTINNENRELLIFITPKILRRG